MPPALTLATGLALMGGGILAGGRHDRAAQVIGLALLGLASAITAAWWVR